MNRNLWIVLGGAVLVIGCLFLSGGWRSADSAGGGRSPPPFGGPSAWQNQGTSAARLAFETHCWAVARTEPDVLLSTIELKPTARALLNAVYRRMTPTEQKSYGSPERMLAVFWSKTTLPFTGMAITGEQSRSPIETAVNVQLQYGAQVLDRVYVFHRHPEGWRKASSDEQVADILSKNGVDLSREKI